MDPTGCEWVHTLSVTYVKLVLWGWIDWLNWWLGHPRLDPSGPVI